MIYNYNYKYFWSHDKVLQLGAPGSKITNYMETEERSKFCINILNLIVHFLIYTTVQFPTVHFKTIKFI